MLLALTISTIYYITQHTTHVTHLRPNVSLESQPLTKLVTLVVTFKQRSQHYFAYARCCDFVQ